MITCFSLSRKYNMLVNEAFLQDTIVSAGGILIDPATELVFLIYHRTSGEWLFPKGRQNQDETLHTAAEREIREETGYTAQVDPSNLIAVQVRPLALTETTTKIIFWYMAILVGNAANRATGTQEEHEDFDGKWHTFDDAIVALKFSEDKAMLVFAFYMFLPSKYNSGSIQSQSFSLCEQDDKGRLRACFMAPSITHIGTFSAVNKKTLKVYVHEALRKLPQTKMKPADVAFGRATLKTGAGIGKLINFMPSYPIGYHVYYDDSSSDGVTIEYLYFGEVDSEFEEESKSFMVIEEALKVIPIYQSAYLTKLL